jgi:hypothetical protein
MSEAAELDQACSDAEVQACCQQYVDEEPSSKEGTHWIDENSEAVPQSVELSLTAGIQIGFCNGFPTVKGDFGCH